MLFTCNRFEGFELVQSRSREESKVVFGKAGVGLNGPNAVRTDGLGSWELGAESLTRPDETDDCSMSPGSSESGKISHAVRRRPYSPRSQIGPSQVSVWRDGMMGWMW